MSEEVTDTQISQGKSKTGRQRDEVSCKECQARFSAGSFQPYAKHVYSEYRVIITEMAVTEFPSI